MNANTQTERSSRGPYIAVVGLFLLLGAIAIVVFLPRLRHNEALKVEADAVTGPPVVVVTKVKTGDKDTKLELPGTVQAFEQAAIFARTNGYVKARYVDIGDHVRQGQLLALIEDPTTEQSLRQAQANVMQLKAQLALAEANAKLADANDARWRDLYAQGVVSKLDADTRGATASTNQATVEAAKASIAAAEATVLSLQQQLSFSRVTAPFDGVILTRNIDNGSLITSGSSTNTTQMFTVGRSDTVRVFSSVPQAEAVSVMNSKTANVGFRELPSHPYPGSISRTSASIDPTSRTILVEIDLKNDGKILPGMYATIQFDAPRAEPPTVLPTNALFVRTAGPQTFVVGDDNVVRLRNLVLGRDMGNAVEIVSGLKPGENVVINPTDMVVDGVHVSTKALQ
jgi:RND family efflux transporter MFP subunit